MTSTETIPAADCFGELKACPTCLGDARECPRPWHPFPIDDDVADCLICHGTDPECPYPHGPLDWPNDADQAIAEYVASLIPPEEC